MSDVHESVGPEEREELAEEEREANDLVRAPDLNQEDDRSATRLELFFDLAFVLYVARCADLLAEDETWSGGLKFAALLSIGWWAWASTTLYANRFDTDDTVFRVLTLVGMAGVVAMAASVDGITGDAGAWFVLGYVAMRVVLILGYLRAWRHVPRARSTIRPYLIGHAAGAVVWLVSLAVPAPERFWLWGVGVLVDLLGPTVAARVKDAVPLHMEHLPERFGLFVILVLGESVAGEVTAIHDGDWTTEVVGAGALGFLVAAALWWSYFDLTGGAAKRRLLAEGHEHTRQGVHDFYVYMHLPLAVSLAALAVGLEHAVLHAAEGPVAAGTRGVLAVGLAGYLATSAVVQGVMSGSTRAALLWPGAGVPVVLALGLLDVDARWLLGSTAAVLLVGLAIGVQTRRRGEVRTAKV